MKKYLLFLLLFLNINLSIASEDVIILDTSSINRLSVPNSPTLDDIYSKQNEYKYSRANEDENSFSEEDLPDNKALRMFYKFVDDRAVNNKLNQYTSSMIDKIDETDDSYDPY